MVRKMKFRKEIKKLAIVFAAAVLFLLPACSSQAEQPLNTFSPEDTVQESLPPTVAPDKLTYHMESVKSYGSTAPLVAHDGTVYQEVWVDGSVCVVSIYPESKYIYGESGLFGIYAMCSAEDGLWLLEKQWGLETGLDHDDFRLVKISYNGEKLLDITLDDTSNSTYELACDGLGYCYVLLEETLWIVSPSGEVRGLPGQGVGGTFLTSSDSRAYVWYSSDTYKLYELTPDMSAPGDAGYISMDSVTMKSSSGTYRLFNGICGYVAMKDAGSAIYGITADGSEVEVFNFSKMQIPRVTAWSIFDLGDGTYYFYAGGDNDFLLVPGGAPEKTTLKMAVFMDTINYTLCVSDFNAASEKYYIDMVNYCADGRSIQDAITLLNTELMAGNGPDIICFDNRISPNFYGAAGFLTDLNPFIENDITLSRDDILLADLMEQNGSLYALAANFRIETWYTFSPSLDGRTGWSYDDFLSMEDGLPDNAAMTSLTTPEDFYAECLTGYIAAALDWDNGVCSFNNEAFTKILDISASIGASAADVSYCALKYTSISSPQSIAEIESGAGTGANFVGWPTIDGSCGSIVSFSERFAISSRCTAPEGAWEFICSVLYSDTALKNMTVFTAPVLKSELEADINDLLHPEEEYASSYITQDEDGIYYVDGQYYGETDPRTAPALISQAQADKFYQLLEDVHLVAGVERTIKNIATNEAQYFFHGDISASDAAKRIESKVKLYIGERT